MEAEGLLTSELEERGAALGEGLRTRLARIEHGTSRPGDARATDGGRRIEWPACSTS